MTTQRQNEEIVILTIVKAFNSRTEQAVQNDAGFVRETDFVNDLTELIRARDPQALRPGRATYSADQFTEAGIFRGNSQKIVAALSDIFKQARDNERVLLSEALPGQGTTASDFPGYDGAREIILTTMDSLYNIATKEKLPFRTEKYRP